MGYLKYLLVGVVLGGLTITVKSGTNVSQTPLGCSTSPHFTSRSVAIDTRKRVHVIWADGRDTGGGTKRLMRGASGRLAFGRNVVRADRAMSTEGNPYDLSVDDVTWGLEYYVGPSHLYYRRSLNGGVSWEDTIRIADSVDMLPVATIATNDLDAVHVLYGRLPYRGIYYRRSLDGGASWSSDTVLDADTTSGAVSMATVGVDAVHAIWRRRIGSDTCRFVYARSVSSGLDWQPLVELADAVVVDDTSEDYLPFVSIAASEIFVHLVWQDLRDDSQCNIYYKRSTNRGDAWESDVRLTTDTLLSVFPTVAASGNMVYVGWLQGERQDSVFQYYFSRSVNGGMNWESPVCLIEGLTTRYFWGIPQVSARDELVVIGWGCESQDSVTRVWFKYSENQGLDWSDSVCVRFDSTRATYPSAVIDDSGSIHIVWTEWMEGCCEIYHTRYLPVGVKEKTPHDLRVEKRRLRVDPNPFCRFTTMSYAIAKEGHVTLRVYDVTGRVVRTLVNGRKEPGNYEVRFSAEGTRFGGGETLAAGVYFVRLDLRDSVQPVTAQVIIAGSRQ
jgi:hypothetical protein